MAKPNKADQKAAAARAAKQEREDREAAELRAGYEEIARQARISKRRFFGRGKR